MHVTDSKVLLSNSIIMQKKPSDKELIEAILNGETQSFEILVKRYQSYVFTLVLRFTKSREEAEEIAQDVFIKAYKYLNSYKQEGKFTTWLYKIAYHTAMTHLRKKRLNTSSVDDENVFIQLESENAYHDNYAEQKSKLYYVNEAIKLLSPDDATIITLFYKGEQSLEEISQIMELETNNIKVKLHRARHRLKQKLEFLLKSEVNDLI